MGKKLTNEDFLKRARRFHGDRYQYPEPYTNSYTSIAIECKLHGMFRQLAKEHMAGANCPLCMQMQRPLTKMLSQEEFFDRCNRTHNSKYRYPKPFAGIKTPLYVECPIHGGFLQLASNHMKGSGCRKCSNLYLSKINTVSKDHFIIRARKVHGDKYEYPGDYLSAKNKVEIICPKHSTFWQTPSDHTNGYGCPKCGSELSEKDLETNRNRFTIRVKETHGDKYRYPGKYINARTKIAIECPHHGVFYQIPDGHIHGSGCPKCSGTYTPTLEEFEVRARKVHGGKYQYLGPLITLNRKTNIVCPFHGEFKQLPSNHLNGKGCIKCTGQYSKAHQEIVDILSSKGLSIQTSTRQIIKPFELDIYVPSHKLGVEFNGDFWHSLDYNNRNKKNKHRDKFQRCQGKGVKLMQILEHEWKDHRTRPIWESMLAINTGKAERKILARKTKFQSITKERARDFLEANHLQGSTPRTTFCYGLLHGKELVAVATFSWHNKKQLNLSRMAFLLNTSVVGGASKLFCNALKHLPVADIITFSNNLYSDGKVYSVLGFVHDRNLPVSYQWYKSWALLDKRQCRHKYLPQVLGDSYRPQLSEHHNMFRAGWRCLYDAGYQRWVYRRPTPSTPEPALSLA